MKILDCTLRDGGYYTNWDFDSDLVDIYIESFNHLPVDYLEIGYRANPQEGYLGEFRYCPEYAMANIKRQTNKKLAIILNEKNVRPKDVDRLLTPCEDYIDLIRIAIKPKNFERALKLGEAVNKKGFDVSFNVMYMSDWETDKKLMNLFSKVDGIVDYLYLVDSYGGVYPDDVQRCIKIVRDKTNVKLGFHGHNNLQMALGNTLTAINADIDIIDSTITGMGRGAGNLRTELLMTVLNSEDDLDFDFNWLSRVTEPFQEMQKEYGWGTSLPYMVSGANSIPQKKVMEWVNKRYYSFNSIIRALSNRSKGIKDNADLPEFNLQRQFSKALIVGGGNSPAMHKEAVRHFLKKEDDICIIHASSKNARTFKSIDEVQIHALVGNEGHRLEKTMETLDTNSRIAILPPYPRMMGTYVPKAFNGNAYQLNSFDNYAINDESVTTLCIETALKLRCEEIYFIGYDGYKGDIGPMELELFNENEEIFAELKQTNVNFFSLTPTRYQNLPIRSIYSFIS